MVTALSPAPSSGHAWRMRAAIVVDVTVGLATLPALGVALAQLYTLIGRIDPQAKGQATWWSVLLPATIGFVLLGASVVLLTRLAARGQTLGLAVVGLRWDNDGGRAAWRRLLAELQFWCAALPIAWAFLILPGDTTRFFVPLISFWGLASIVNAVVGPALLVGALACMVVLRRSPGRLVRRG